MIKKIPWQIESSNHVIEIPGSQTRFSAMIFERVRCRPTFNIRMVNGSMTPFALSNKYYKSAVIVSQTPHYFPVVERFWHVMPWLDRNLYQDCLSHGLEGGIIFPSDILVLWYQFH